MISADKDVEVLSLCVKYQLIRAKAVLQTGSDGPTKGFWNARVRCRGAPFIAIAWD